MMVRIRFGDDFEETTPFGETVLIYARTSDGDAASGGSFACILQGLFWSERGVAHD